MNKNTFYSFNFFDDLVKSCHSLVTSSAWIFNNGSNGAELKISKILYSRDNHRTPNAGQFSPHCWYKYCSPWSIRHQTLLIIIIMRVFTIAAVLLLASTSEARRRPGNGGGRPQKQRQPKGDYWNCLFLILYLNPTNMSAINSVKSFCENCK